MVAVPAAETSLLRYSLAGLQCLPNGRLIVPCTSTHKIYVIDPITGDTGMQAVTGTALTKDNAIPTSPYYEGSLTHLELQECICLEVADDECSIYVTEFLAAIRRVQLSDTYFL